MRLLRASLPDFGTEANARVDALAPEVLWHGHAEK